MESFRANDFPANKVMLEPPFKRPWRPLTKSADHCEHRHCGSPLSSCNSLGERPHSIRNVSLPSPSPTLSLSFFPPFYPHKWGELGISGNRSQDGWLGPAPPPKAAMSETSNHLSTETSGSPYRSNAGDAHPPWIAGVRYPSGTEIWCANRGGEAAWTPDRKLAAGYPSETSAAMAARQLTEGNAVPFWTREGD